MDSEGRRHILHLCLRRDMKACRGAGTVARRRQPAETAFSSALGIYTQDGMVSTLNSLFLSQMPPDAACPYLFPDFRTTLASIPLHPWLLALNSLHMVKV